MIDRQQTIQINGKQVDSANLDSLFQPSEPKDTWQNNIYSFLLHWFDSSKTIELRTSGSTGKPKSIQLSKQNMVNSAKITNEFFGLDHTKTALLCLPASYIAGKMMLVRAIVAGFSLISVEPKANPFKNIEMAIDFAAITPYQLEHSVETIKQKKVKSILVGGAQVNKQLEDKLESMTTLFYESYGMTESCSHIALRALNGLDKSKYFTILEGVSIRIDHRDCLAITAPHLFEKEIVTNDRIEILNTKSFRWLGRFDTVINSGAVKIYPELVEKKLEKYIQSQFFISSIPDALLGQKLVIVIESEGLDESWEIGFRKNMIRVLHKYETPDLVFYLNRFIYSENKKILKKETLSKAIDHTNFR